MKDGTDVDERPDEGASKPNKRLIVAAGIPQMATVSVFNLKWRMFCFLVAFMTSLKIRPLYLHH